jgi:hypothetical protein
MTLYLFEIFGIRELIADPPHTQNITGLGGVFLNFGPKTVDMGIDRVFVTFIPVPPDEIQQFKTGIDPTGVFGKLEQEVELFSCQRHGFSLERDLPLSHINFQVVCPDHFLRFQRRLRLKRPLATKQGFDPSQKLPNAEWFG